MMEWFRNEEFWREFFPVLFPLESFARASDEVRDLLALTKFSGNSILDLCCGPGRHTLPLAEHGFHVSGLDLSPYLLSSARERALRLGLSIEWVEGDMRTFRRTEAFDLICNMTTSFGYFDEEEENLMVLRNVWQSLKNGGILLIDCTSKEIVARNWQDCFCTEFSNNILLIQRSRIGDDWSRLHNEWILIRERVSHFFQYNHALYSGLELKERVVAAGFAQVRLFGDLTGAPFGIDASRLIVVAQK
jgi:SAM-dependent methyltransferase